MGERKVQSHYISSDFDPSKVGRRSKPHNGQHDVRFMMPMSIKCASCGDYMFQGTKANSRKELCYNEFYLGIPVYRFYIHCKSCYSEITIKTDPANSDYIVERGASRHFEPWRDVQLQQAAAAKERRGQSAIDDLGIGLIARTRQIQQQDELLGLGYSGRKRKKLKLKDIARIHDEIETVQTLTPEDRIHIENFATPPEIRKAEGFKLPIHFAGDRWSAPENGLLSYNDAPD
jgi:hypothetical protein